MQRTAQADPAIVAGYITSKNPATINNNYGAVATGLGSRNRISANIVNAVDLNVRHRSFH